MKNRKLNQTDFKYMSKGDSTSQNIKNLEESINKDCEHWKTIATKEIRESSLLLKFLSGLT